ncbi:hypothetical protein D1815_02505 [Aquimarina sp. AD1]|uniref:hypothetical protein n=1 Tax=Aquimarina sp. (strain AD1) TaxID=1714848 RepID=UPI000E549FEB|nr:hypothetical protein [Aquimarina sp. AD1]AXT54678.1 hypothetical protein D1815_02505 [Aquimarina sp. AD1]RKN19239.1 hypothetical protein D7035_14005 [Aquimarina sp. AD1]
MKLKNLAFIIIVFLYSCDTEENDLEESINEDSIAFTIAISNLENKNGVIITENTVTFTEDITIPEDVVLNFNVRDRMIINSDVTVTINGIISAGKFQIFEIADGGKVNGCPQIEYITPQWWGTDDSGSTPASDNFQTAIESFDCIKKFVSSGKFLVDKEILLNIDERSYDFTGSHFIGTEIGTLFGAGGLVTIGNRNFNFDKNYSVENVTVQGGIFEPKYNHDNSLSILNSKNIKISDITIFGDKGLRGIALQTPGENLVNNPIIENIIIENILQEGGVNVINIDLNHGLVKDVIINNVIGSSINEINPQNNKREAAFRCSGQISPESNEIRIDGLTIDNVLLDEVYMGFNLRGIKTSISNVEIDKVDFRGFNIYGAESLSINNVQIKGSGANFSTTGIYIDHFEPINGSDINLSKIELTGEFGLGIWNRSKEVSFTNVYANIKSNNTVIKNTGDNCVYSSLYIKNNESSPIHAAIFNGFENNDIPSIGINANFDGVILGNFTHGVINQAQNSNFNFQFDGTFNNGAFFTFYNANGYSSVYRANMNLSSNSTPINNYRNGDLYELYVYDPINNIYVLNP